MVMAAAELVAGLPPCGRDECRSVAPHRHRGVGKLDLVKTGVFEPFQVILEHRCALGLCAATARHSPLDNAAQCSVAGRSWRQTCFGRCHVQRQSSGRSGTASAAARAGPGTPPSFPPARPDGRRGRLDAWTRRSARRKHVYQSAGFTHALAFPVQPALRSAPIAVLQAVQ